MYLKNLGFGTCNVSSFFKFDFYVLPYFLQIIYIPFLLNTAIFLNVIMFFFKFYKCCNLILNADGLKGVAFIEKIVYRLP